jgi:hypothetical protein
LLPVCLSVECVPCYQFISFCDHCYICNTFVRLNVLLTVHRRMHCLCSVYYELTACTCFQHYLLIFRRHCLDNSWYIVCVCYVCWLLPGLEFNSNPGRSQADIIHTKYANWFIQVNLFCTSQSVLYKSICFVQVNLFCTISLFCTSQSFLYRSVCFVQSISFVQVNLFCRS